MPKDPIAKWQLINDDFYIDTNDFKIESEKINFWIKKGNYEKTRLIIDCQNLRYRETFEVSKGLLKRSAWNPVLKNNNYLLYLQNSMKQTSPNKITSIKQKNKEG